MSDLVYLIQNPLLSIKPYCHKLHGFARVDVLRVSGALYIPLNERHIMEKYPLQNMVPKIL